MQTLFDTEVEVLEEDVAVEQEQWALVVFNDDVNTFEHVIQALIEVCKHTPEQAEQCTWIIHFKGKCTVKNGSFDELASMRNSICNRGISAEVL
ncbi:ATP-dependent Clp protease adaptor ClpS [Cytophagaceae bacterium DM2B3-1]|uniref:ATP-dependent Clp protease adaptor ClpS n=2 Tax=Xanthocytophaga TaxID=3078918 RepID=A0AAE3QQM0_9BACT|nr:MULTISPECIES: ATP-dependent Clp protease adaptor ClpS [Xanthocytophaga]MDJ1473429.1 ATP-dependent Clp protease adaptor ClpS [Xanthocytophaga flavus]MDJ1483570.1 ATP-dependent Clp protease adaptor ClpS [Xanthocytophaga flavus]MDJ1495868.1 ATP-dependent Clp protease adaptor ClpS [Xanthocytophaga flavus]MDJ1505436.1 ATP-dependent Clp protease adaptor ClpS [Xanthocytophaga agilis]